ncbi:MAG: type I restriction enzyme HsdR N-terminal domain-containing protein [Cytophagales bacterium]|nr:type I restriction enzyme HsdR N-terminal domain-containing protein [Cytophagales bacterium]
MQELNLPSFDCKIKESDGKTWIFDPIRKKYIVLTPEEWVRQHVVNLLVEHFSYSKSLIKIEGGLKYEKLAKRTDIVVFDKEAKPYLLIECKAPEVNLSKKTISQAAIYNKTIKAPHLAISNGLKTFCFEIDFEKNSSTQKQILPPSP